MDTAKLLKIIDEIKNDCGRKNFSPEKILEKTREAETIIKNYRDATLSPCYTFLEETGTGYVVFSRKSKESPFVIKDINSSMSNFLLESIAGLKGKSANSIKLLPKRKITEIYKQSLAAGLKHKKFEGHTSDLKHHYEIIPVKINDSSFICYFNDITDKKNLEEELIKSISIIEESSEAVIVTGIDGNIMFVNPAFEKITGYSRNEVKGKPVTMLESGRHTPEFQKKIWETITKGEKWHGEIINKKKNGALYEMSVTIAPLFDKEGNITAYVSSQADISKLVKLEHDLNQSRKMQAMGTLAGGIAHDFNNILMGILGYTEMGLSETADNCHLHDFFQQIAFAGYRARDLVRQILLFSRSSKKKQRPLQISLMINEVMKFLSSTLPSNICIKKRVKTRACCLCDPSEIHQILMNLCSNAAYVMRDSGGNMIISVSDYIIDMENSRNFKSLKPGPYVKISVSDTGPGIPGEYAERIFEPFFTTKPKGESTGMGLSLVHSIVRELGGEIKYETSPKNGTVFEIFLPSTGEISEYEKNHIKFERGNGERVLFVDDEEPIIDLMRRMLEKLNYKVSACSDPVKALEKFRLAPEKFDVVITDYTMPGLSGATLAESIIKIKPDIPVAICSGYGRIIENKELCESGIREILAKPLSMWELSKAMKRMFSE
jgi:PAS domain S-box-containing protein